MSQTDAPRPAAPATPVEASFQTASDRLEALRRRLSLENHVIRAAVIALGVWILKIMSSERLNSSVQPARSIESDAAAEGSSTSAPDTKPLNPTMAASAPPNFGSAPKPAAGGAGGISKNVGNAREQGDEDNYRLARLHRFFERNAGWGTILTAAILVGLIGARAGSGDLLNYQWNLAPVALHLLFIILMFTRPLRNDADINTIFRFAWCFVTAATIFGLLFLIFGFKTNSHGGDARPTLFGIFALGSATSKGAPQRGEVLPAASSHPNSPSGAQGDDRVPHDSSTSSESSLGLSWTSNLVAIVRGCDFNSVAYRNARATQSAATSDAKTGKTSSTTPADSLLVPRTVQPGMPEGVNCGDLPPQWVIVIGGSILECDFDGTCPKIQPRPNFARLELEVADLEEDLKLAIQKKQHAEDVANAEARFSAADAPQKGGTQQAEGQLKSASDTLDDTRRKLREAKMRLELERKRGDYHLNIEGGPVVGGLVIPVFFVAVALMGALINMGRKLPEFQERVDPLYKKEFDEKLSTSGDVQTPISAPYARDMVVFQIIQVLSTPGIAILAFSWARPEDQAVTVIVAFAAGFTSEVFLLAVRGVVDRVIGLGPRPPRVRAMLTPESRTPATTDIPPRGPAAVSSSTAGGLKVGDLVTLLQPLGVCMPGAQGKVLGVGAADEVIVQTFQDHTGAPLSVRLPSQSASFFRRIGDASTAPTGSGPAG